MAYMIWLEGSETEEFLEFGKANDVVVIDVQHASGSARPIVWYGPEDFLRRFWQQR
jgi:hypothetical protein